MDLSFFLVFGFVFAWVCLYLADKFGLFYQFGTGPVYLGVIVLDAIIVAIIDHFFGAATPISFVCSDFLGC